MMKVENFPQQSEKKENKNIIQVLGLEAGSKLSLRKRSLQSKSALEVGHILEGKLKHDVRIGLPIEFDNGGRTSNVQDIIEKDGKYVVTTLTSVYEIVVGQVKDRKITDYESFVTERGSVYTVLDDGKVIRFKTAQLEKNYIGDDKYDSAEKKPADIILFYKPTQNYLNWFGVGALDPKSDKKISQTIDIGVYKKGEDKNYHLVTTNKDLNSAFVFVRVKKDDAFKLKNSFTTEELQDFQKRTLEPANKGLGLIIPSESGDISNIPIEGYKTFDFRYNEEGEVESMHNGNMVVSVKEKV